MDRNGQQQNNDFSNVYLVHTLLFDRDALWVIIDVTSYYCGIYLEERKKN